jgi:DNA-binding transcriptional regulator GbsR (MarR family)
MKLTPVMEKFVLFWGEMGTRWGVNRSVAQIHALLYLSEKPMTADQIQETLGIARSNISNSLKELQSWNLAVLTHQLGERKDHFTANKEPWEMVKTIAEGRKTREIDPALTMLRGCAEDLENDQDTPLHSRNQILAMQDFLDEAVSWYDQMRSVPTPTLMKLMRMGSKIVALVGIGKSKS